MARSLLANLARLLAALVLIYLLAAAWLAWEMHVHTDVDDYADYLEEWSRYLVAHFPARPGEAGADPVVSYFPGFLQGGAHLQLRVRVSPEAARQAEMTLSERAIRVVDPAVPATLDAAEPRSAVDDAPLPPFYAGETDSGRTFPRHFRLFYLVAQPGTTDGFPWNHGRTAGVAVSVQPPEIVYWAERW